MRAALIACCSVVSVLQSDPAWAQPPASVPASEPGAAAIAGQWFSNQLASGMGSRLEAHDGWIVVVRGRTIEAVGPADEVKVPGGCSHDRA